MKLYIFLLGLFITSFAKAEDIIISNFYARQNKSSTTFYLDIENTSNQIDYLIGIEIIGHPKVTTSINKTVIEKNTARVIHIDQLAIPPKTRVKLAPLGIFIIANHLFNNKPLYLKFIFRNHGERKNKCIMLSVPVAIRKLDLRGERAAQQ